MGTIRVRQIQTGKVGSMPEENFNPQLYERLDGGSAGVGTTTGNGGNTSSGLSGIIGSNQDNLQSILGLQLIGQNKLSQASTVLSKVGKKSAQDKALEEQKRRAAVLNGQLSNLGSNWDKMSILERLPIPGISRVSKNRATYDTARDTYTLMLNSMVADKRISDKERDYYLKLFPQPLSTKSVADARIKVLRDFVNEYSGIVSPYSSQETSGGGITLDDILNSIQ